MSKAKIIPGICGFTTYVEARMNGSNHCDISIDSECKAIQNLAKELRQVEPFKEITFREDMPLIFQLATKHCHHTACPVSVGIIKAVEVEAGVALPANVTIELSE